MQIIHILVDDLFPCFLGTTSVSGSLNLQSNTFLPSNHHHPFPKHAHTITIYFFVLLFLCLPFVTAALIQCKVLNPFSHHTSFILISARRNARSLSLFKDYVSLPHNIQLPHMHRTICMKINRMLQ